jgi:hypothetical protein
MDLRRLATAAAICVAAFWFVEVPPPSSEP